MGNTGRNLQMTRIIPTKNTGSTSDSGTNPVINDLPTKNHGPSRDLGPDDPTFSIYERLPKTSVKKE